MLTSFAAAMMSPGPPPASGNSPYFFASNNPAGMMAPPMQGGGGYNPQEVVDPSTQYQQPNIMTPQPPAMQQPQLPPAMMEPAAPVQQQTIQQVWSLTTKIFLVIPAPFTQSKILGCARLCGAISRKNPIPFGEKKPYLLTEWGLNLEPRASEEDALSTLPPDLGSKII